MLTYSIPAYRMPKDVMAAQVDTLQGMGIRFELGAALGAAEGAAASLHDLREHYESVFLATGLWTGRPLRLEKGELLDSGLEFLIGVQAGGGTMPRVGERVLVIGGGSVAVDVALTARRLGAREVTMACLESLETMPAILEDVEQALEEGIIILPSWGPRGILEAGGKLTGMELVRCTSVFDRDGRFAPSFDQSVTTTVSADQVLVAIGQAANLAYAEPWLEAPRGLLMADKVTGATAMPGVFAGGDVTGSSATMVQAMASGQRAAASIDAYLAGAQPEPASPSHIPLVINEAALPSSQRVHAPRLPVDQRTLFTEDCGNLSLDMVEYESTRCANCGCVAVSASDLAPALIRAARNRRDHPAAAARRGSLHCGGEQDDSSGAG